MAKHPKRLRAGPTRQTHDRHCSPAEVEHGYPLRSWAPAALFHEAAALLQPCGSQRPRQRCIGPPSRCAGCASTVGVPMRREGVLIGAIAMWRTEPRASPPRSSRCRDFADPAVIAIENTRLLNEMI